jgi:hypothetical protein
MLLDIVKVSSLKIPKNSNKYDLRTFWTSKSHIYPPNIYNTINIISYMVLKANTRD